MRNRGTRRRERSKRKGGTIILVVLMMNLLRRERDTTDHRRATQEREGNMIPIQTLMTGNILIEKVTKIKGENIENLLNYLGAWHVHQATVPKQQRWSFFSMQYIACGRTERSSLTPRRSKDTLLLLYEGKSFRVYCFRNLKLRTGEILIDKVNSVEDTKGNNGVAGALYCVLAGACYCAGTLS